MYKEIDEARQWAADDARQAELERRRDQTAEMILWVIYGLFLYWILT